MNLQFRAKYIVLLSLFTLLVGCGFHLRGDFVFPEQYKAVYVQSNEPAYSRESVAFYVKRALASQMKIVDSQDQADLIITIDAGYGSKVESSNLSGTRRGYSSSLIVRILVINSQGQVILPNETFSRSQDYTIDEREPLAKTTAEEAIEKELSKGVSDAFVRRLKTVIREVK